MGCAQRPRVNTSSREGPNPPQPLHAGRTTTTPQSLQHTYTQKANITSSFEKDVSLRLYYTRVLGLHVSLFALFLAATSLIPQKGLGPGNGCVYPIIFSCSQNQAMKSKDVIWENVIWPGFAKRALWACPELTQLLNLLSFGFGVCWTEPTRKVLL